VVATARGRSRGPAPGRRRGRSCADHVLRQEDDDDPGDRGRNQHGGERRHWGSREPDGEPDTAYQHGDPHDDAAEDHDCEHPKDHHQSDDDRQAADDHIFELFDHDRPAADDHVFRRRRDDDHRSPSRGDFDHDVVEPPSSLSVR
jgi:hypothetical protein